jgi:serine/threonine protein kinase
MNGRSIGRYEIREEIGRGGFSTVYRAYDPQFKREVALKVLPQEFLHDPTFRARFEREATTIAALEHPAIVPVYDFGEQGGQLYLVMRFMQGKSLKDRLAQGAIPAAEAARILDRIAPALDYAHRMGIIHRDLKPDNILFDQHDEPYLSDFGIAKLSEGGTLTGNAIVGTPAYMSPEQARGEAELDGRSDVYALGAVLFEMLTGQLPYSATTPMGQALKHITDPVPNLLERRRDLPPALQNVIALAMAKRKESRFATASDLAKALSSVVQGEPLPELLPHKTINLSAQEVGAALESRLKAPRPIRPGAPKATQPQRIARPRRVYLFFAGLLLFIGSGTAWYLFSNRQNPEVLLQSPTSTETAFLSPTKTFTLVPALTLSLTSTRIPTWTVTPSPRSTATPTLTMVPATLTPTQVPPTQKPTATPVPTRKKSKDKNPGATEARPPTEAKPPGYP